MRGYRLSGFSLAATWCGWEVIGHVEIDPWCRRVLAKHWPDALRLNDLREVRGDEWGAVDVVAGGIPCFAPGTMVLTEDGYRPIESVAVGDRVLTHLGRWRRVTSVMVREDADLIRVSAQGVPNVITTHEHPFYARQLTGYRPRRTSDPDWVDAGDLGSGHYVAQVYPCEPATGDVAHPKSAGEAATEQPRQLRSVESGSERTCAFWWLVGRYLADGWRIQRSHRPWAGRVIICCAHHEADALNQRIIDAGYHVSRTDEATVTKFIIQRNDLYRFLEPFGHRAHGKCIPGFVYDLDVERSRALLEGYLSGDGYRDAQDRFSRATTASRSLALGIALLAQRALGVVASVRRVPTPPRTTIDGRDVGQRDWYAVQFPDRNRSAFIDGDYGWKKVKRVEPAGRGRVHNISVDEDESYVVEGAVVHNCQPFSVAGKQGGAADDRHLWPEVARILAVMRPKVVVVENVSGFVRLALDDVLADLEAQGYACGTVVLPAASVGAPHRRERVWVVACANGDRRHAHGRDEAGAEGSARSATLSPGQQRADTRRPMVAIAHPRRGDGGGGQDTAPRNERHGHHAGREEAASGTNERGEDAADAATPRPSSGGPGTSRALRDEARGEESQRRSGARQGHETQPGVGVPHDGLPGRLLDPRWLGDPLAAFGPDWEDGVPRVVTECVDRTHKLKALGNALVPQIPYLIFQAMEQSA